MSNDQRVSEAAERVRLFKRHNQLPKTGEPGSGLCGSPRQSDLGTAVVLSPEDYHALLDVRDAHAAEHDPTPYSGDAWLQGNGLAIGVTKDRQGRWWAEAHQDDARIVLCEIKTHGQLRRLAQELDIPLEHHQ